MTIQKTYTKKSVNAYPGMLGDIDAANRKVARVAEVDLEFGLGAFRGTDKSNEVDVAGTLFLGVAIRDHTAPGSELGQYNAKAVAGILREGPIWVELETAGAPGDVLTVDTTSGRIGTTAADGTHLVINAELDTAVSAPDGLGLVMLGLNK